MSENRPAWPVFAPRASVLQVVYILFSFFHIESQFKLEKNKRLSEEFSYLPIKSLNKSANRNLKWFIRCGSEGVARAVLACSQKNYTFVCTL